MLLGFAHLVFIAQQIAPLCAPMDKILNKFKDQQAIVDAAIEKNRVAAKYNIHLQGVAKGLNLDRVIIRISPSLPNQSIQPVTINLKPGEKNNLGIQLVRIDHLKNKAIFKKLDGSIFDIHLATTAYEVDLNVAPAIDSQGEVIVEEDSDRSSRSFQQMVNKLVTEENLSEEQAANITKKIRTTVKQKFNEIYSARNEINEIGKSEILESSSVHTLIKLIDSSKYIESSDVVDVDEFLNGTIIEILDSQVSNYLEIKSFESKKFQPRIYGNGTYRIPP